MADFVLLTRLLDDAASEVDTPFALLRGRVRGLARSHAPELRHRRPVPRPPLVIVRVHIFELVAKRVHALGTRPRSRSVRGLLSLHHIAQLVHEEACRRRWFRQASSSAPELENVRAAVGALHRRLADVGEADFRVACGFARVVSLRARPDTAAAAAAIFVVEGLRGGRRLFARGCNCRGIVVRPVIFHFLLPLLALLLQSPQQRTDLSPLGEIARRFQLK